MSFIGSLSSALSALGRELALSPATNEGEEAPAAAAAAAAQEAAAAAAQEGLRRSMLAELSAAVASLAPLKSCESWIDSSNETLAQTLELLERIIFFSSVTRQGFPLVWDMLHEMDTRRLRQAGSSLAHVNRTVAAVDTVTTLTTAWGKARGWLRQSLNTHTLGLCLREIHTQSRLHPLHAYYRPGAFLTSQDVDEMITHACAIDELDLRLNLSVDDIQLNSPPDWIKSSNPDIVNPALTPVQTPSPIHIQSTTLSRNSSHTSEGENPAFTFFDRMLNSIEKSLDSMIEGANAFALEAKQISRHAYTHTMGMPPLFGTPLKELLLNEYRCAHALLDPTIGVPQGVRNCMQVIHAHLQTEGLFHVNVSGTAAIRKTLEAGRVLENDVLPVAVGQCLIDWLMELDAPLIPPSMHEALYECFRFETPTDGLKNMRNLMEQLPWEVKPLLVRLMRLFAEAVEEANAERNKLNMSNLSNIMAPVILGHRVLRLRFADIEAQHMDQSSTPGAWVVETMIRRHEYIFESVREDLRTRHERLKVKCLRLSEMQTDLSEGLDMSKPSHLSSLKQLWVALETPALIRRERVGSISDSVHSARFGQGYSIDDVPEDHPEEELVLSLAALRTQSGEEFSINSARWDACGLVDHSDPTPLASLKIGGVLTVRGLATFLERHPAKAHEILLTSATSRGAICSISQIASSLTRVCAEVLQLLPSPDEPAIRPAIFARNEALWKIFDDKIAFEEVFSLSMCIFDAAWVALTDMRDTQAHHQTPTDCLFETRKILSHLLTDVPVPCACDELWTKWEQIQDEFELALSSTTVSKPTTPTHRHQSPTHTHTHQSPRHASAIVVQPPSFPALSSDHTDTDMSASVSPRPSHSLNADPDASSDPPVKNFIKETSGMRSRVWGDVHVLNQARAEEIEPKLPIEHQGRDWHLMYSLAEHGASLVALLSRCRNQSPAIFVIRDTKGAVFGGFTNTPWAANGDRYYGTGECCVFTFVRGMIEVYPWSRMNSYFQLTNEKSFAMGGGGNFAIYLDSDILNGTSSVCETFNSECLASAEDFECEALEMFVLRPGAYTYTHAHSHTIETHG